jgi:hypothetical protein
MPEVAAVCRRLNCCAIETNAFEAQSKCLVCRGIELFVTDGSGCVQNPSVIEADSKFCVAIGTGPMINSGADRSTGHLWRGSCECRGKERCMSDFDLKLVNETLWIHQIIEYKPIIIES